MDDDPNEPTLPPLPPPPPQTRTRPSRPSLMTRKRTHSSYATDLDPLPPSAASSDPALFSGDEAAPGAENYEVGKRKKKMYTGSWWSHHVNAGKSDRKREFKRNVDSGVWMGSDEGPASGSAEEGLSSDSLGSMEEAFLRDQGVHPEQHFDSLDYEGLGPQFDRTPCQICRTEGLIVTAASLPEHDEVRAIIRRHLDLGIENVNFDGMKLSSLPVEIQELATLVKEPTLVPGMLDTGRSFATELNLLLSNNLFTRMPMQLLDLSNLRVLSLRGNKLTSIPAGIRRLTRLRQLNVCNNRLTSLPFEVMELFRFHDLRAIWTGANPWMELPSTVEETDIFPGDKTYLAIRRCVSATTPPPSKPQTGSQVPSLTEVALRQLYKACPRDDLRGLMPEDTPPSVSSALDNFFDTQQEGGRLCTACKRPFVKAALEWVEWWYIRPCQMVPFKRGLCSPLCEGKENDWVDIEMTPEEEDNNASN